ncbi:UNVERIFIED_CONTAM: hypothetical protein HDU68_002297 [Siphonaria sp. JEL0065]|nr:hypothetical protein HDU68_002297 [Siphonaria sp. JEL0065]
MKKKTVNPNPSTTKTLQLSLVFGLNERSLCVSRSVICFSSGGVVSVLDLATLKTKLNQRTKKVVSLAISNDNSLVALGEAGHHPRIALWNSTSNSIVTELVGHKFGVLACAFSPNGRYLVSVGFQHDGYIYVWNTSNGRKVACNRISAKITSVIFDPSGLFFITSGFRHFKYWAMDSTVVDSASSPSSLLTSNNNASISSTSSATTSSSSAVIPLVEGTFATVGEHKNSLFMDLVCFSLENKSVGDSESPTTASSSSHSYSITEKGILVLFNEDRVMEKWVDLKMVPNSTVNRHRAATPTSNENHDPESPSLPPHGLPPNSFVTYSSDTTIRFWNIDGGSTTDNNVDRYFGRNIYSKELMKVIYTNRDEFLAMQKRKVEDHESAAPTTRPNTDKSGIRSLRISIDGSVMATGDRSGNLRVFELNTFTQHYFLEAHDGEILGIDFTQGTPELKIPPLMATASRDRLIHVFDVRNAFSLIQTLDDHTSSITGVKFSEGGKKLSSSAADKSIVFRSIQAMQGKHTTPEYTSFHNTTGRSTIFDIDICPSTEKSLAAVTQDRRLNLFSTATGKLIRTLTPTDDNSTNDPPSTSTNSGLLKVCIDPTGRYAATAGGDRQIRIFDLNSGVVVAKGYGHSEVVTCVKFSLDCERVVSTSADGCVFVWKLGDEVVRVMKDRLGKRGGGSGGLALVGSGKRAVEEEEGADERAKLLPPSGANHGRSVVPQSVMREDVQGRVVGGGIGLLSREVSTGSDFMTVFNDDEDLPAWARSRNESAESKQEEGEKPDPQSILLPQRGMWAKRVEEGRIQLYSEAKDNQAPVATFTSLFDRRYSIESSIGNLTRAGSSGSIPASDIVVQEVEDVIVDAIEEDGKAQGVAAVEESTLFVGDSEETHIEDEVATEAFTISEHGKSENENPESVIDEPILEESKSTSLPESDTSDTEDPSGKKVPSLEEYLNSPVDPNTLRQSISAKHVMSRDPSRKVGGGILVEAVLGQIKEQEQSFEAAMSRSASVRVETMAAGVADSEMVEKKAVEDLGSPIKSPLSKFSGVQLSRTASAVNKEVIEAIATTDKAETSYENDSFEAEDKEEEEIDGKIDTSQVLKDLKRLKTLTDATASLLQKLEAPSRINTVEEVELSQELRLALTHVKASAASALEIISPEVDEPTTALLERYSNLLVGLVREKLVTKIGQEQ